MGNFFEKFNNTLNLAEDRAERVSDATSRCRDVDGALAEGEICAKLGVEEVAIEGELTLKQGWECKLMPNLKACKLKAEENAADAGHSR